MIHFTHEAKHIEEEAKNGDFLRLSAQFIIDKLAAIAQSGQALFIQPPTTDNKPVLAQKTETVEPEKPNPAPDLLFQGVSDAINRYLTGIEPTQKEPTTHTDAGKKEKRIPPDTLAPIILKHLILQDIGRRRRGF